MTLPKDNTIDIYSIDTNFSPIALTDCYALLNQQEREQAARFKFEYLSERYIYARGLLRFIISGYLNCQAKDIVFEKLPRGKPYLLNYPQLHFNISHSNEKLLIALSKELPIGIDIEQIKMRKSIEDLVLRCLAPTEQSYWFALAKEQQLKAFYQFWTRKEAFVKATGFGIALGLEQCVINPIKPTAFLTIPEQCGLVSEWQLMDLAIDINYCSAIAAQSNNFSIALKDITKL
jgi:4'-phosphopantetheinyl transferase